MENQIRLLGVLNIASGSLTGLVAIFQILFFGGGVTISIHLGFNTFLIDVWIWTMLSLMIPSIVLGIALLGFRAWARTFGIILSILELVNVPLGTAVGLYGLWVLFSERADLIFTRRYGEYLIGRR